MKKPLIVVPAYGRDYKTEEEAKAAWEVGWDFFIMDISCRWDSTYCSARDRHAMKQEGYDGVKIRFNGRADFVLIPF